MPVTHCCFFNAEMPNTQSHAEGMPEKNRPVFNRQRKDSMLKKIVFVVVAIVFLSIVVLFVFRESLLRRVVIGFADNFTLIDPMGNAINEDALKWVVKAQKEHPSKIYAGIQNKSSASMLGYWFLCAYAPYIYDSNFDPWPFLVLDERGASFHNEDGAISLQLGTGFSRVQPFSEGLAAVMPAESVKSERPKWGYVDTTGTLVIPAKYDIATPFSEGLAVVACSKSDVKDPYQDVVRNYMLINHKGEEVLSIDCVKLYPVYDGIAGVNFPSSNPSFCLQGALIDTKGNVLVNLPDGWELFGPMREGLAPVETLGGRGFINKAGKVVIDLGYTCEQIQAFSCGRAAIKKNGKWGYIDKKGEMVIAPQYKEALPFFNEQAVVSN